MLAFPEISPVLKHVRMKSTGVVKKFLALLPLLSLSFSLLWGQDYPLFQSSPGTLTCVWNKVPLRKAPGKSGPYVSRVYFGEQVEKVGEEAYLPEEKRTYVKVRSSDGQVGWVHEYLFVSGGTAAVVLQEGQIYERPNTPSTITMKAFVPGEIVVMETAVGDWINLIGREKKKSGWIKGMHKVTSELRDIELATLLESVEAEKDPQKQREKLTELLEKSRQSGSPLTPMIAQAMSIPGSGQALIASRGDEVIPPAAAPSRSNLVLPRAVAPNLRVEAVRDPFSGHIQDEIIETGGIYPVQGPAHPRTPFFAYHKSLPIGSRVYVQLPEGQGVIALEVINRLREDNPHVLGLAPGTMQLLFGDKVPEQISISYLKTE